MVTGMAGLFVLAVLFVATVAIKLTAKTRMWFLPGTAALFGAIAALVSEGRAERCHDGAVCAFDAIGHAIVMAFAGVMIVTGLVVLAISHAIHARHLAERAALPTIPEARVL